jgi:hypothetical protein
MSRIFKVILDLMVVKFLLSYSQKPIYVFGGLGLLMILGAFLSGGYALYLKIFRGVSFILTPLPLLCVLLLMLGFLSVLMGFLAKYDEDLLRIAENLSIKLGDHPAEIYPALGYAGYEAGLVNRYLTLNKEKYGKVSVTVRKCKLGLAVEGYVPTRCIAFRHAGASPKTRT